MAVASVTGGCWTTAEGCDRSEIDAAGGLMARIWDDGNETEARSSE